MGRKYRNTRLRGVVVNRCNFPLGDFHKEKVATTALDARYQYRPR